MEAMSEQRKGKWLVLWLWGLINGIWRPEVGEISSFRRSILGEMKREIG